eukprot:scaffold9535_cov160-Skeletonema_marinoi.AAC.7
MWNKTVRSEIFPLNHKELKIPSTEGSLLLTLDATFWIGVIPPSNTSSLQATRQDLHPDWYRENFSLNIDSDVW